MYNDFMHHYRVNSIIAIVGLIFGIFSGISVFMMHSTNISRDSDHIREVFIDKDTDTIVEDELEPEEFCVNVPILTYHHIQPLETAQEKNQQALTVEPSNFDWHMSTLIEKGYTFISLTELVEALESEKPLDGKKIVITLDDGYRDAYTYAYPIAKKYGITLNIGLITGLIGNPEHLTSGQIIEMNSSEYVHFYNHTWSHRNLKAADTELIASQINTAREHIVSLTGSASNILIYPYGVYDMNAIHVLKENNFRAAAALEFNDKKTEQCVSDIYSLHRLRIGNAGPGVYDLY